jgi:halocyanin-like protein
MQDTTDNSTGRRAFMRQTAGAAAGTAATLGLASTGASAQSGPDYGGWFENTTNFDGTYDFTGQSEVTVAVGAPGNGGDLAFSPAAIRVDPGTTVIWEWTGKGGGHNVVAEDGSFESELTAEAGTTFEHTFESEGTVKYKCVPHETLGMKGAVAVGGSGGLDPSELSTPSGAESGGGSGGDGGESHDGGGSAGGAPLSFEAATLVTALVVGVLSPLIFGAFLFLKNIDDEPPARPHE